MDSDEFSKKLSESRKDKVTEVALSVCRRYGLPTPKINFNGCPEETEDQLAHYHPDQNKICISEFQLNRLKTMYEIERTVYHELAHMLEHDHGGKFEQVKNQFSIEDWRPPKGVIYIDGSAKPSTASEEPPAKTRDPGKSVCNYPGCNKKANLSQCTYCKRYFCTYHKTPILPGSDVHGNNYHACAEYYDYAKAEERRKSQEYTKALDKLKNRRPHYEPSVQYDGDNLNTRKKGILHKLKKALGIDD